MPTKQVQVQDREATDVYAVDRIGPQRRKTPEGFLLCENVPIARTGWLTYTAGQTPVSVNAQGLTYIVRDANTLFDPVTLSSFNGKPVTMGHPPVNISPADARLYQVGTCLNPRQGEGPLHDCIVADLLITDQRAIDSVESAFRGDPRGMREVSAGYSADYEELFVGEGRQTNIVGNHVALVPRGRCGPRCAVNDHFVFSKERPMPGKTKNRVRVTQSTSIQRQGRFAAAVRDGVEAAMQALGVDGTADPVGGDMVYGDDHPVPDGDEGGIHVHVHLDGAQPSAPPAPSPADQTVTPAADDEDQPPTPTPTAGNGLEDRVAGLEASMASLTAMVKKALGVSDEPPVADEKPDPAPTPEDTDEQQKPPTQDSAALKTGYQQLTADAEVLVPGFRMPTFDAAATRAATISSMCGTRRTVLSQCMATTDGAALLTQLLPAVVPTGTHDIATMDCAAVGTLFAVAASTRRAVNNAKATAGSQQAPVADGSARKSGPRTPADINKANADFWAARTAAMNS